MNFSYKKFNQKILIPICLLSILFNFSIVSVADLLTNKQLSQFIVKHDVVTMFGMARDFLNQENSNLDKLFDDINNNKTYYAEYLLKEHNLGSLWYENTNYFNGVEVHKESLIIITNLFAKCHTLIEPNAHFKKICDSMIDALLQILNLDYMEILKYTILGNIDAEDTELEKVNMATAL